MKKAIRTYMRQQLDDNIQVMEEDFKNNNLGNFQFKKCAKTQPCRNPMETEKQQQVRYRNAGKHTLRNILTRTSQPQR